MELSVLQSSLEEAESSLKNVDSKIKEATGFDPSEKRSRIVSRVGSGGVSITRRSFGAERRPSYSDDVPDAKRRRIVSEGGVSESTRPAQRTITLLSVGEHSERTPTLQSAVVVSSSVSSAPQRPARTPGQSDARSVARNKRMFGMLMGTLQKFKSDESTAQIQARKQKEIDERLEETKRKDREETIKQREGLFRERREQTAAVNHIKAKIELVELEKDWNAHRELLKGDFIMLKSHPRIFYCPAVHTDATRKLVDETHKLLDEEAAKHHEALVSSLTKTESVDDNQDRHGRAENSGSAAVEVEEGGLTFDAATDGITGLPGVEDGSADIADSEVSVKLEADDESLNQEDALAGNDQSTGT